MADLYALKATNVNDKTEELYGLYDLRGDGVIDRVKEVFDAIDLAVFLSRYLIKEQKSLGDLSFERGDFPEIAPLSGDECQLKFEEMSDKEKAHVMDTVKTALQG